MPKVFLTGASGFVGSYVVRRLISQSISVRCVTRPGGSRRLARALGEQAGMIDIVEASLASQDQCERAMAGCSVVLHLAAAKSAHPSQLFADNVTVTRTVARAASANSVARLVHVSSLGVYAPQPRGTLLDERTAVDPRPATRDAYTFSKIVQEEVVWQVARELSLNVVVLRPGVIFGPGASYVSARVGLAVGCWMCLMGGKHPLPYTFVENFADAIVRAAFQPDIDGQVFNIVDDQLPTGKGLVAHAARQGRTIKTLRVPAIAIAPAARIYEWCSSKAPGVLPEAITAYRARALWTPVKYSNRKAKEALGWTPAVQLPDALARCDVA